MREYRLRHVAHEVPAGWLEDLRSALDAYLRTDVDARLLQVVADREKEALEQRAGVFIDASPSAIVAEVQSVLSQAVSERRLSLEEAGQLDIVVEAVAAQPPIATQLRRADVEEARSRIARYSRLVELEAPEVIICYELFGLAGLVLVICEPEQARDMPAEDIAIDRRWALDGHPILGDGEQTALSPWNVVARLPYWAELVWAPQLGDDDALAAHPPVAAFHEANEKAWPSTLGFWDIHGSDDLREDRVLDVYRDNELWTVPGLELPRRFIDPRMELHPEFEVVPEQSHETSPQT